MFLVNYLQLMPVVMVRCCQSGEDSGLGKNLKQVTVAMSLVCLLAICAVNHPYGNFLKWGVPPKTVGLLQ